MLTTVGDLIEDIVVRPAGGLRPGTDRAATIERHRGGSAANVALDTVLAGGSARFVGNVGTDPLGDRLLLELSNGGVEVAVKRRGRTGTIVAIIGPSGERSFLTDRGSVTELDSWPSDWLHDTTVLHLPGYSLLDDPLRATCMDMADTAQSAGVVISVDASSTGALLDHGVERFQALLGDLRPDYLFCNADEADLLFTATPASLAKCVIIKRGADPTIVSIGGQENAFVVPPVSNVVDTTGAGDALAAAFLVARVDRGAPISDAVAAGHRLAAQTVVVAGATPQTENQEIS